MELSEIEIEAVVFSLGTTFGGIEKDMTEIISRSRSRGYDKELEMESLLLLLRILNRFDGCIFCSFCSCHCKKIVGFSFFDKTCRIFCYKPVYFVKVYKPGECSPIIKKTYTPTSGLPIIRILVHKQNGGSPVTL